jgi:hypothetical protein
MSFCIGKLPGKKGPICVLEAILTCGVYRLFTAGDYKNILSRIADVTLSNFTWIMLWMCWSYGMFLKKMKEMGLGTSRIFLKALRIFYMHWRFSHFEGHGLKNQNQSFCLFLHIFSGFFQYFLFIFCIDNFTNVAKMIWKTKKVVKR